MLGRFCEQDILAGSRSDVGAVGIGEMVGMKDEDIVVYCLDGSVLFDKGEGGEEREEEGKEVEEGEDGVEGEI